MRILPDLTSNVVALPQRPVQRRGRAVQVDVPEILRLYDAGVALEAIADKVGCSIATVRSHAAKNGREGRRPGRERTRKHVARYSPHTVDEKPATMPPVNHPALVSKNTIYPGTVISPTDHPRCLIPGENNRKIGGLVSKGAWSGLPIFTLTLEERATCPTTCRHWRSCYGNQMHWSKRFRAGEELEKWLPMEVAMLLRANPQGVVVRLHVLGDFYSVEYVRLWAKLLDEHPGLNIFGFTARTNPSDPITRELVEMATTRWPRFAMRFSNAPMELISTVSIEHPVQKPDDAIICPAQQGQTSSCGTCGLCWSTKKRIAFLQH